MVTATSGTIPSAPLFPLTKDLTNYTKTASFTATELSAFTIFETANFYVVGEPYTTPT